MNENVPTSSYISGRASGTQDLAGAGADSQAEPLRLLHVSSGNLYGGVETVLVTLARSRHLCPAMEPSFALCYEGRLSQELREAGVTVYLLGGVRISRPWTVWRGRNRLRELLNRDRFDVVICHLPWSLAVFGKAARVAGKRLGFWGHGFHTGRNWLERLARRTTPDLAIVNSHYTETGVTKLFPTAPRHVVYNPVAPADSANSEEWRSTVRKQQGVDDATVVILQVSRLEPWKGHLAHLHALSLLKHVGGWVCWMVGGAQKPREEQYMRQLHRTAGELGIADRVRFLGQRSDVSSILAGADIFCQPNQEPEPFGMVFIEALGAALPVVTTALGGAKEIIDGSCGVLVEPGQPILLAAALQNLIEHPEFRARLGRSGVARAAQLCDPATQLKRLKEVSGSAIGSTRLR